MNDEPDQEALDELDDITDYSAVVAEVASDWASNLMGMPVIAANFVLVADLRGVDRQNGIAALTTNGTPDWLTLAMLERAAGALDEGFDVMLGGITEDE